MPKTITAAVVTAQGGEFEFHNVELDDPREDEVLVRLTATGICHTDLVLRSFLPAEMFPRIFGHEGAGVVEAVGAGVTGINVGDHVVLSYRSCRDCGPCREGAPSYCDLHLLLNYMGCRMDGSTCHTQDGAPVQGSFFGQSSFASHALAYADNCVVVDPALDLGLLAPYGCGFQTGAGAVLNVLAPKEGDAIAVFGVGAVGLAAVAAARSVGASVVAVDLNPARLALAEELGAVGINPAEVGADALVQRVKELSNGGPMGAIETTAVPQVAKQAQLSLANRGTLLLLGLGPEEWVLDATDLLPSGKVVRSSIEGDADPQTFIPQLLALRERGAFPLDKLVATYPADQIAAAVADAESGAVVKAVLLW